MAITPNTNVKLLKLPLHINNKNQLTFENKSAQSNYFLSLNALEIDNCTYQRKDNVIRFPDHIDNILQYNYCMYQNENYSDKWFYAYITNMRFINPNMTEISIKTDTWQTWQFDIKLMQSFIEREIVNKNDDVAGRYIIPEGLELGETIGYMTHSIPELEPMYVLAFTFNELNASPPYNLQRAYPFAHINGLPQAVNLFIGTETGIDNIIRIILENNKSDGIMTIFTVPKFSVDLGNQVFGEWNTNNVPDRRESRKTKNYKIT